MIPFLLFNEFENRTKTFGKRSFSTMMASQQSLSSETNPRCITGEFVALSNFSGEVWTEKKILKRSVDGARERRPQVANSREWVTNRTLVTMSHTPPLLSHTLVTVSHTLGSV